MKRTNLITYQYGKFRRVYEDKDGKLYYRMGGHIHGIFKEYCIAETKEAKQ